MIKVGRLNRLEVIKVVPFGLYLDGEDLGEILLPNKVVPKGTKLLDRLEVFIYYDSEDKIIATTVHPDVQLGTCGFLKVIDVNRVGAFLDWGLDKDLLVPLAEQQRPMVRDKSYIVYVKQDQQGRLLASSKLDHFLDKTVLDLKRGDEVDLLIAETSPMGTKVIINDCRWGLIHASDLFQKLSYGSKTKGYIKTVRDDGKIDVVLRKLGQDSINEFAQRILADLKRNNGFLPLHDKSKFEEIQSRFGESKKSFKNAIGHLYKQGLILIEPEGIRLKSTPD